MPLRLLHSNRVEVLLDALAETLSAPPEGASPLAPETVLLDNPSLGKWLNLQLALKQGVAANIRYVTLSEFFWQLAREAVSPDIPSRTPLAKAEMSWRLFGALRDPAVLAAPELAPVRAYLGDEAGVTELKRWQLAARVADLFDQYLVYRPHWVTHFWDADRAVGNEGRGRTWAEAERWPRFLWRTISSQGAPGPLRHRAAIQAALTHTLAENTAALSFQRLSVFGVTAMAPAQLEWLHGLARHVEVHLYLFDPCQEAWFDLRSQREIAAISRRNPDGEVEEIVGNPLLAGQAGQVRDFLNLLYTGLEEFDQQTEFVAPDEQRQRSLLACLQQDVLEAHHRGEYAQFAEPSGQPQPLPPGETASPSVHVHNCHGPLREVEVLHDQLLDLFRRHPDLNPRDVVVMMPRVGPYVPYIRAVFESADPAQRIPYHINDLSLEEESPVLKSFQALLGLPDSRLPLSEVLGLLEVPAVHRRFGLDRADYEALKGWLVESGARWGLDAAHRAETVGAAYGEFSWAFGRDRLMAGYALADGDDAIPESPAVAPLAEVEGGNADVLDGFLQFWNALRQFRGELGRERGPGHWRELLNRMLDTFFQPEDDEWRAFNKLKQGVDELRIADEQGWFSGPVPLQAIQAMMRPVLAQPIDRRHPWSEGVKFCSLLPMRGVPFQVVYLLGMNMEDYPRRIERPSFDLMRGDYRPGDRSARMDDRWLFLEALLSARREFHASYVGQDMHRNESREPSVVLSELIDTIRDGYGLADPSGGEPGWPGGVFKHGRLHDNSFLYTRHPLQPFSPAYFQDAPNAPRSFDRAAWAIANARQAQPPPEAPRWAAEDAPEVDAEAGTENIMEIDLDSFVDFFADPPKWFLRQKGATLGRWSTEVSDEETWQLESGLGAWRVVDRLLQRVNAAGFARDGETPEAARERVVHELVQEQRARGDWPLGGGAEKAEADLLKLKPDYLALLAGRRPERQRIELPLSAAGSEQRLMLMGELPRYDGEYIEQSVSKISFKHMLSFYLRSAAASASVIGANPPGGCRAVFRDTAKPQNPSGFRPRSINWPQRLDFEWLAENPGRHLDLLRTLGGLYLAHRGTGLPFAPELSFDIFQGADPVTAAEGAWASTQYKNGLGGEVRSRAYYGSVNALGDPVFVETSRAVWQALYRWLGREGPE